MQKFILVLLRYKAKERQEKTQT